MKRGSIAGFLAGGALLRRRPCSSFPSPSPSPLSSILRPRMFSSAERQDFVLSPEIVKIMNTRMKAVEWRHAQLTNVLSQPGTSPDDYAKSNKELSKLEELVRCISTLRAKQKEIISLQTLMDESADDVEICKMAMDELQSAQKEESKLQQAVLFQMLPRDEADSKSCILEVRAGTGGEEAALFAVDLFKMYERYALGNSWKFEVVDIMETGIGGYKDSYIGRNATPLFLLFRNDLKEGLDEMHSCLGVNLGEIDIAKNPNLILAPTNDEFAIYCLLYNDLVQEASALIAGVGAYGKLKFESGVHRVQRVPLTEKSGRIHTSAASVAVLPKADEVDVQMRNEDLRIDTYRSGGSGGQHANTTNSAVRITHIPTGLVVAIQDERSQHMNKAKAMEVLRSRLYEIERRRVSASHSELRQELIGSGDRSERIRTYNFPQGRVTDHRVGITQHAIESVMQGEGLDTFIDALKMKEEAGSLAYLIGS